MIPTRARTVTGGVIVGLVMLVVGLVSLIVSDRLHQVDQNTAAVTLLTDCVTPGPNPAPATGHVCWDRLHDPKATDGAVALIVDDLYCDQRRAQHKLPAVPDPTMPCRNQTDPSIYPGGP